MSDNQSDLTREAADKAAQWVTAYVKEVGLKTEDLSPAQWFIVAMQVPCAIRCWRVGVSIRVAPGQPCPECGKVNNATYWDILKEGLDLNVPEETDDELL